MSTASAANQRERILVVAAHPDDEALGCGGTLAARADCGAEITAVFLTDGVSSRRGGDDGASRRRSAERSAALLGIGSLHFLCFPDNACDSVPLLEIVHALEPLAADFRPDRVFVHHGSDLNVDHRIAHQAALTLFRALPGSSVREILAFEVPSSSEWAAPALPLFRPTVYFDIGATMERKRRALEEYSGEMRESPHPRSLRTVDALAVLRGSSAGLACAEAFELVRSIRP